jgi:hypothetical protein
MVDTIRWMVIREPEAQQRRVSVQVLSSFLLGGVAGGAVAGGFLALLASVVAAATGTHLAAFAFAAGLVGLAYLGQQAGLWRIPKVSSPHQVPKAWRSEFSPRTSSLLYSGALGLTFFTKISSYMLYPLVVLLLGLGAWPWAVVSLFALVGLTRAATGLLVPIRRWAHTSTTEVNAQLQGLWSVVNVTRTICFVGATVALLLLPRWRA